MNIDKITFHKWDSERGEVVEEIKYNIFYHGAKVLLIDDIKEGIQEVLLWDRIQRGELLVS